MRRIAFVLASMFAFLSLSSAEDSLLLQSLADRFPGDMARARKFFSHRQSQLTAEIKAGGGTPQVLCSVVFPEVLRFSILRDSIETSANEVFYTQLGKDYSNFSIGPYQMKPSFAEYLESEAIRAGIVSPDIGIWLADPSEVRRARLTRLMKISGATNYLIVFEKLMRLRFPEIFLKPESEQVLFLASAYNAGPQLNEDQIRSNQHRMCFPYGCGRSSFAYAEISQAWFENATQMEPTP